MAGHTWEAEAGELFGARLSYTVRSDQLPWEILGKPEKRRGHTQDTVSKDVMK